MRNVRNIFFACSLVCVAVAASADAVGDGVVDAVRRGDRAAAVAASRAADDPAPIVEGLLAVIEDKQASTEIRRDAAQVLSQIPVDASVRLLPTFETASDDLRLELIDAMGAHRALLALASDSKARCSLRTAAVTRYWSAGGNRAPVHALFSSETTPPCVVVAIAPLLQQDLDRADLPTVAATASRLVLEGQSRNELLDLLASTAARLPQKDATRLDHAMLDVVARPAATHRRIAALLYLQKRGVNAPPDPGMLLRIATDDTAPEALRDAALGAVGSLGRLDAQATGRLTNFASRPQLTPRLRRAAFEALAAVGAAPDRPVATAAAPALASAMTTAPASADGLAFTLPRISPMAAVVLLGALALLAFFIAQPIVLDRWVRKHLSVARERFAAKETVKVRSAYVPMPLELNDRRIEADDVDDAMRALFRRRCVLLISGEGGSGKTSIAVKLANDALAAKKPMLPVLIEHDFDGTLLDEVREQLHDLLGINVAPQLARKLLRQGRVLLIIDHYSELQETSRRKIDTKQARAVIITSRNDEQFLGRTVINPTRIRWSDLTSFMEHYLRLRDKLELFSDREFHEACRNFAEMTHGRDSTILLARLFADLMISAKEKKMEILPRSVPELMVRYVRFMNVSRQPGDPNNDEIQRAARLVAWECVKQELAPARARLDDIRRAVGDDADELLEYLERDLALIEICEPARAEVRFTLDPLAEYLAALHITELHGDDVAKWESWVELLPDNGQRMRGFLRAVLDCIGTGDELELAREAIRIRMTVFAAAA
ncbi:MAG TPA: hypothetical protein VF618_21960 [Thermoanaerobaculia bacterium]